MRWLGRLTPSLLAGMLLLVPAGARGAATIGARRIIISTTGAAATVTRDPFGLSFATGPGAAPKLSEVVNTDPAPSALGPTLDPDPPGTEPAQSEQLSAPLSYLVGSETIAQYDGLVWGGNLLSGTRAGVQYAARRVVSAIKQGGGVSLTVSTDDRTGRTLQVRIAPDGGGRIEVTVTPHPDTGVALMSDSFRSAPSEAFYGFGGRHDALDQHGRDLASWVEEENLPNHSAVAGTPSAVLFPGGPSAAYYPQAQFVSSRGFGFLLDQPQLAWFRMDSDRPNAWSAAVAARTLRYIVAPGGMAQVVGALTAASGRQPAPPAWGLGPMLDRLVRNFGETETDYTAELFDDLANIARHHVPLKAYRIEGWGLPGTGNDGLALHTVVSFANQARVIKRLEAMHIHPLAYLRPWLTPGSAPVRAGYAVRNAGAAPYMTTGTAGQNIALLDFTNPAAVRWWREQVAKVLNLGFDGFMADFGEEVLADMHFADGQTGATMHNEYPILYMKATRQAVDAYERTHPARGILFFNRAGYSGTPGSAAYESANFPGDEATNWSQASGLASLTPDMLGRAIGGAYGYGTDIGGYFDLTTPPTTKQLFLRWAEWAALSPVFRLHGSGLAGTHTPWSYDRQTVSVYNALSKLHQEASPLILQLWREADRTGIPPTRPLWLQFPGDSHAAAVEQEWMLGPDVLVAPVVTANATSERVYFPRGCWRDPRTRLTERGPRSVTINASLTHLPFFFACATKPFPVE